MGEGARLHANHFAGCRIADMPHCRMFAPHAHGQEAAERGYQLIELPKVGCWSSRENRAERTVVKFQASATLLGATLTWFLRNSVMRRNCVINDLRCE